MPRKPSRKYGRYDFFVLKDGKSRKLLDFAGMDKRGFLYRWLPMSKFRRMK